MLGSGVVMLMQYLNGAILASMGPSNAGKIQCVVMDFHAENEYTVFKDLSTYILSKSPGHKKHVLPKTVRRAN